MSLTNSLTPVRGEILTVDMWQARCKAADEKIDQKRIDSYKRREQMRLDELITHVQKKIDANRSIMVPKKTKRFDHLMVRPFAKLKEVL